MNRLVSGGVLAAGEILVDLIASDGSNGLLDATSLAVRPGGAPANAAVALARQGLPVAFLGVVGQDPFGERLITSLSAAHVDTSLIRSTPDAETSLALAWKDANGDGHFRLIRMADRLLSPDDIDRADVRHRDALVIGSVSLAEDPSRSAIERAVAQANKADVPVCFDVNVRPSIWSKPEQILDVVRPVLGSVDLIKASVDDVAYLSGSRLMGREALAWLDQFPARFLIVTDGSRGAWFAVRSSTGDLVRSEFVPAFAVDAIDPTGAGDAFTAAILSRLLANEWQDLTESDLHYAAAAGALTTTRHGAIDALPTRSDILSFLASVGSA